MLFWLITRYVSCWALMRPVGKGPCKEQMGKPSGGIAVSDKQPPTTLG